MRARSVVNIHFDPCPGVVALTLPGSDVGDQRHPVQVRGHGQRELVEIIVFDFALARAAEHGIGTLPAGRASNAEFLVMLKRLGAATKFMSADRRKPRKGIEIASLCDVRRSGCVASIRTDYERFPFGACFLVCLRRAVGNP